jgi:hypothetical protein
MVPNRRRRVTIVIAATCAAAAGIHGAGNVRLIGAPGRTDRSREKSATNIADIRVSEIEA